MRAARPGRVDAYHRRMASSLRRDTGARDALRSVGIDDAAIADLGLGLKDDHVRTGGEVVSRVLSYPIAAGSGRGRFGCVNLAGVSVNPEHEVAWSAGEPATVRRGDGGGALLVVDSPILVWRFGMAAARLGLDVTVMASSQPERRPADWASTRFWGRWPRVVVMSSVPPVLREAIAGAARRPLELARLPAPAPSGEETPALDGDWLSDVLTGVGRVDGLEAVAASCDADAEGDFVAAPIALHGGLSGGQLLYPFRVERRVRAGPAGSRMVHSYHTLVLRGDGAVLEHEVLPAPPGTPAHRRVHALSDGTRVRCAPEPSRTPSWSLAGIRAYAAARLDGCDPSPRAPSDLLTDVHALLSSRVSLPRPEDMWVATGFVVASHLFRVFSALPILLVKGGKGSGKSELAGAIASLGYNATVMGQGSAAALVRLAVECGGLVVLDDVEKLAGDGGFGELGQALKVGYRAQTARKPLASSSGRVEVADFFGPRVITTTLGLDPILASRSIEIATRCDGRPRPACGLESDRVRDELHALAMSRVAVVAEAYAPLSEAATTRAGEIRAPLLAIADAFGCAPLRAALADGAADRPQSAIPAKTAGDAHRPTTRATPPIMDLQAVCAA